MACNPHNARTAAPIVQHVPPYLIVLLALVVYFIVLHWNTLWGSSTSKITEVVVTIESAEHLELVFFIEMTAWLAHVVVVQGLALVILYILSNSGCSKCKGGLTI